jgi:tRNA 2-(methylsulfanyl)-N6-isopentenyladenosine37 hydroxylase
METLGLELPTDPRWVNIVEMDIREILIDHAYCEQKAASACISLIILYPEKKEMVGALTPVVAEEWSHFERVMEQLRKRGYSFGPQRKDEYVNELQKLVKKGGNRDQQLCERLLINALIEARSCERFKLLSKQLQDDELKKFYYELMISEAGHYRNFLDLAMTYQAEEKVWNRWKEILKAEAEIMKNIKLRGDRIH